MKYLFGLLTTYCLMTFTPLQSQDIPQLKLKPSLLPTSSRSNLQVADDMDIGADKASKSITSGTGAMKNTGIVISNFSSTNSNELQIKSNSEPRSSFEMLQNKNIENAKVAENPGSKQLDFIGIPIFADNKIDPWINRKPYHIGAQIRSIESFPYLESFDNTEGIFPVGWESSNSGSFDWLLNSGHTNSANTGPLFDNTTSSGFYFYTTGLGGMEGDEVSLLTPVFDLNSIQNPVLGFAYHMFGDEIGDLEVHLLRQDGTSANIFSVSGQQQHEQTEPYEEVTIFLGELSGEARFEFKGIRGSNVNNDIAIDDITIYDAPNVDLGATAVQIPGEFVFGEETVTVSVHNFGFDSQNGFVLTYFVNDIEISSEIVEDTIEPNGSLDFTFETAHDFSTIGTYDVRVELDLDGDENPNNNTATMQSRNDELLFTGVYSLVQMNPTTTGVSARFGNGYLFDASGTSEITINYAGTSSRSFKEAYLQALNFTDFREYTFTMDNGDVIFDHFQQTGIKCGNRILLGTADTPGNYSIGEDDSFTVTLKEGVSSSCGAGVVDVAFQLTKLSDGDNLVHDLGLTSIRLPTSRFSNSPVPIKIEIENFGITPRINFEVSYSIDGELITTEIVPDLIKPTESIEYTFSLPLDESELGSHDLLITIHSPGDQNSDNDQLETTFEKFPVISEFPYLEDFDADEDNLPSGWQNAGGCDFEWIVNSGSTPTKNTGPESDHTSGTGNYVYTEPDANGGCEFDDEAILITPAIDLASVDYPLLTYFYHNRGLNIHQLNVDVIQENGNIINLSTTTKFRLGLGDDPYHEGSVFLGDFGGQVIRLQFRTLYQGELGDLALDDVSIENIIGNDLAVTNIPLPIGSVFSNDPITTTITNFGGATQSEFDLTLYINEEPIANETVITTLGYSESMDYTFETPFDFSEEGTYELRVEVHHPEDQVDENNSFTKTVVNTDYFTGNYTMIQMGVTTATISSAFGRGYVFGPKSASNIIIYYIDENTRQFDEGYLQALGSDHRVPWLFTIEDGHVVFDEDQRTGFSCGGNPIKLGAAENPGIYDPEDVSEFTLTLKENETEVCDLPSEDVTFLIFKNKTPTNIQLSSNSIEENAVAGALVGLLSTVDPNSMDVHEYMISGDDAENFQIIDNQIQVASELNYEGKSDYSITITSVDGGGLSLSEDFDIRVLDVNEPPSGLTLDNTSLIENEGIRSLIGHLAVNDEDIGDIPVFTIEGVDANRFLIGGQDRNELQSAGPFNFEIESEYEITLVATDRGGLTTSEVQTISIVDENERPTLINLDNASIGEGSDAGTLIGLLSTVDEDVTDDHTYSITGPDAASFQIGGDGDNELQSSVVFDAEAQSVYFVTLTTTDAMGLDHSADIMIEINDVNESPSNITLSTNQIPENQSTGTIVGLMATEDEDAEETHTFSLVVGTGDEDNGSFTISGNNLLTNEVFDFETKSTYSILVRSEDSGGLTVDRNFTIGIIDADESGTNSTPTDIDLTSNNIAENEPSGSMVGTFSSVDTDVSDTHTYTIISGESLAFAIDGANLVSSESFDFETQESYTIIIRTTDSGGSIYDEEFIISISEANDDPTAVELNNSSIPENESIGTSVGTLSTIDADASDTHLYSISGEDAGSFEIGGSNNDELHSAVSFDFEDKNTFSITLTSTDQGGSSVDEFFTITITDANEAPASVSLDNTNVLENEPIQTIVGLLTVDDFDDGDSHTFSISGIDASSFQIGGTNSDELQTSESFNFENQASYAITITTTDAAGLTGERDFTIEIRDENESPDALDLDANSTSENGSIGTLIGTITTSDVDAGDAHIYTISGPDASAFQIGGANGDEFQHAEVLDFETQSSFSITITSVDVGGLIYSDDFTINVTDENEAPESITLSNGLISENLPSGTLVGSISIFDVDNGDTFTLSISGTDAPSFQIGGDDNDELQSTEMFDFESRSEYSIMITATDAGGLSLTAEFEIYISDVNDRPLSVELDKSTINEHEPTGTAVGILSTIDQDEDDIHSYTLSGVDAASFQIGGGNENELLSVEEFDFETKSSYSLTLTTTDGDGTEFSQDLIIMISDVNEAPTAVNLSNNETNENLGTSTIIGTLSVTDIDESDSHTYSISGDDANSFQLGGTNGDELQNAEEFNFETKSSYTITVTGTDNEGLSVSDDFTIEVTDENESPFNLLLDNTVIAENEPANTFIGRLSAEDQDAGDHITFTISGTGQSSFQLGGANEDELQSTEEFDFETKSSYTITVTGTDNLGLSVNNDFTIEIADENESPLNLLLDNAVIAENELVNTIIGVLSTEDHDTDDQITFTISGTDQSSFQLGGDHGDELQNAQEFDFEIKSSYTITVTGTDNQGLSVSDDFTIEVTDENESPFNLLLDNTVVVENEPANTVIGVLSAEDHDADDQITFTISGTDQSSFQLGGTNGNELQSAEEFDFETKSSYTITVTGTDNQGLSVSDDFTIEITNENESPFNLVLDNTVISENEPVNTVIGVLSAEDHDTDDQITFTISGTDQNSFQLGGTNGDELQNVEQFDFEIKTSYTITVTGTDNQGLSVRDDFTIEVTDENESPFNLLLDNTVIAENEPVNTFIGMLSAEDHDTDDQITFTISGTDQSSFQLGGTNGNELQSAEEFDFETKSSYTLTVTGTDNQGLGVSNDFTIEVINENESPINLLLDNTVIAENEPVNTIIGILSAEDQDADDQITFTISGTDQSSFQLGGDNGDELQSAVEFDFETKSSYTLTVTGTDNQGLGVSNDFTIEVLNENESPFNLLLDNTVIAENEPVNTNIGMLSAEDHDADDQITFTISGTDQSSFQLGGANGNELQSAEEFDFETKSSYTLTVTGTDNQGLSVSDDFTIEIADENESPFNLLLDNTVIAENEPVNTIIGILSAEDQDAGDHVTFTISGTDQSSFQLGGTNGDELQSAEEFDFEMKPSYSLTVIARDALGLSVSADITIAINDVDEPLGIGDLDKSVKVYPNPSRGRFTLELGSQFRNASWKLYSIHGVEVSNNASVLSNGLRRDIDLSFVKSGIYILTIDHKGKRVSTQISILK